MHASHAVVFISLLPLLVTLAVTQSNGSFCNRIYHSSIVVNDKLYVDGGELRTVRWPELWLWPGTSCFVLTWPGNEWYCIGFNPNYNRYGRSLEIIQQRRLFNMGTYI